MNSTSDRVARGFALLLASIAAAGCQAVPSPPEASPPVEPVASAASALTAADVMSRGFEWVNAGCMQYCQAPNYAYDESCSYTCQRGGACDNPTWNPYRSDCSGFLSWAWGFGPPGLVVHEFWPIVHLINVGDLSPGDALIEDGNGHIMLFNGWVDGSTIDVLHEGTCYEVAAERVWGVNIVGPQQLAVSWTSNPFWAVRWNDVQAPCPHGGMACTSSGEGVCAAGTLQCVGGSDSCVSNTAPSPEICDGLDNDCNGVVDDGFPQQLSSPPPDFAATLVDLSYPPMLHAGEHATGWAEFRNVGHRPWPAGGLWLNALGAAGGAPSQLFAAGSWPAWNVAAVLEQPALPGEIARFTFELAAPEKASADVTESFQLGMPGGALIGCPSPAVSPTIHILPRAQGAGAEKGAGGAPTTEPSPNAPGTPAGCSLPSHADTGETSAWLAALSVGLLVAARRRRAPTLATPTCRRQR